MRALLAGQRGSKANGSEPLISQLRAEGHHPITNPTARHRFGCIDKPPGFAARPKGEDLNPAPTTAVDPSCRRKPRVRDAGKQTVPAPNAARGMPPPAGRANQLIDFRRCRLAGRSFRAQNRVYEKENSPADSTGRVIAILCCKNILFTKIRMCAYLRVVPHSPGGADRDRHGR